MGSRGLRTSVLDERHALVQRVAWSRHFEKSTRVRELLQYVCDRGLEDPAAEIHEQELGQRVFGRSADYDTGADNIVRVTASQARKKLELYFGSEGISEPIILEIPKGRYTAVFRERTAPLVETPLEIPQPGVRALHWPMAALSLIAAILAGAVLMLAVRLHEQRVAGRSELEGSPALNSLWSQLLSSSGRTDIVVADSSLSLFQELLDHQLTLAEYLKPGEWTSLPGMESNPLLRSFAQRAAQRRFTSLASVTAANRIAQIAGKDQSRISIVSARDFNIRQLKADNVILIGSKRANPWAELMEDRLNFRFNYDQTSRYSYFENRQPRPGESENYRTDSSGSYCQIAFLPNLGRTGNVLTVSGTEVEGTEGGSEFVTSESSLAQLQQQLQAVVKPLSDGRLPFFEILLKGKRVGGATPSFSIISIRSPKP